MTLVSCEKGEREKTLWHEIRIKKYFCRYSFPLASTHTHGGRTLLSCRVQLDSIHKKQIWKEVISRGCFLTRYLDNPVCSLVLWIIVATMKVTGCIIWWLNHKPCILEMNVAATFLINVRKKHIVNNTEKCLLWQFMRYMIAAKQQH